LGSLLSLHDSLRECVIASVTGLAGVGLSLYERARAASECDAAPGLTAFGRPREQQLVTNCLHRRWHTGRGGARPARKPFLALLPLPRSSCAQRERCRQPTTCFWAWPLLCTCTRCQVPWKLFAPLKTHRGRLGTKHGQLTRSMAIWGTQYASLPVDHGSKERGLVS